MKTVCPEDEMIADYLEGRMSEKDRFDMERHVSECENCLDRLVVTGHLLFAGHKYDMSHVPADVTESAVQALCGHSEKRRKKPGQVVREKWDAFSSRVSEGFRFLTWGEEMLQPVRGEKRKIAEDIIVVKKSFDGFAVEINIEKLGSQRCQLRVLVFPERLTSTRLRVTLEENGREVASQIAGKESVVFEELPFGRYAILLSDRGTLLRTYTLDISEFGCGEKE